MWRILIMVAAVIGAIHSSPVVPKTPPPPTTHVREINDVDKTDIIQILHTFGVMRHIKKIEDPVVLNVAIRRLQELMHLPVTGIMDQASFDVLMLPRCGTAQDTLAARRRRKRFAVHTRHNGDTVTWSFNNQTLNHPDVGLMRRIITKSFNLWLKNTNVTVREVASTDKKDYLIGFFSGDHKDGYPFDGFGKVLAHAFYPGSRYLYIHFDSDEPWIISNNPEHHGVDFANTALHEIGHALGLAHSSDPKAIMFGYYKVDRQNPQMFNTLPADDQLAISSLYGEKVRSWGPYKKTV